MRELIALLLLVCLAPVQAFAANCPASTVQVQESAVHGDHSSHEHHGAEVPGEPSSHHLGDCGLMVSCGSALLPVPTLRVPVSAATSVLDPAFAPSFYSSPSPHFDPPPPRILK